MQNLTKDERGFLLALAITTRGDVSAEYSLQRYKAVQGPALKSMVRELAAARLIVSDGRSVRLTEIGRR